MQQRTISMDDLAMPTGEPAERLAEGRALGLIGAPGADEFPIEDVERVRLVQSLLSLLPRVGPLQARNIAKLAAARSSPVGPLQTPNNA